MSSLAGYGPGPFTVATFRPWLDSRSPEERWELIDGVAVMSPAPRVAHQRIASNFEHHLRQALAQRKPEWIADREIGIEVAEDSRYRPEPEITVVDTSIDPTQNYLDRFYMAVEVVSESDKGKPIAAKVAFYKDHPHARWIVLVQQNAIEVEIHERQDGGAWTTTTLTDPAAVLAFGEVGPVCTVADLYRHTHLDPAHRVELR
jgi:Uma2 family endonuclease